MAMFESTIQALTGKPEDKLSNNKFFFSGKNDAKILAEREIKNGKFGEYVFYKGDFSLLDSIADEIILDKINPSLVSNEAGQYQSESILIDSNKETADKTIKASTVNISPKEPITTDNIRSFETVFSSEVNAGISNDEREVYVWYQSKIGMPLSGRWAKSVNTELSEIDSSTPYIYEVSDEKLMDWYSKGLIFIDNGSFVPAYIYQSGTVFGKVEQLEKDKEFIVSRYGEGFYKIQFEALNNLDSVKKIKRLNLTGDGETGLIIKLKSNFSASHKIKYIQMMDDPDGGFRMREMRESSPMHGQPDLEREMNTNSRYDSNTFKELNLFYAFAYWLIKEKEESNFHFPDNTITKYEIVRYYMLNKRMENKYPADSDSYAKQEQENEFKLTAIKKLAERTFAIFLYTQLDEHQRIAIELSWNSIYNNYNDLDINKIPVAFTMCEKIKGITEKIKQEKRDAVSFIMNNGKGLLAYEVGTGKTISTIFTVSSFMDAGYCKRPFIVVPNQVYKQFISEIHAFAPHIKVNEAYNLNEKAVQSFMDNKGNILPVSENSITVMTYEGMRLLGFTDRTISEMTHELVSILAQEGLSEVMQNPKKYESLINKVQTLMGKGIKKTLYTIDDFGFDFICLDEAHRVKKLFVSTKSEKQEDVPNGKVSKYKIQTGQPSSIAIKAFIITQFILKKNKQRNVLFLTATPFTNNPLEIFSMLCYFMYDELKRLGIGNCSAFFDLFLNSVKDLAVTPSLELVYKEIVLGFFNINALQGYIRKYMLRKEAAPLGIKRPNKYVLPLTKKIVNGTTIPLEKKDQITTYLTMTDIQKKISAALSNYIGGAPLLKITLNDNGVIKQDFQAQIDIEGIMVNESLPDNEDTNSEIANEGADINDENQEDEKINEQFLEDKSKTRARILKALSYSRQTNLSPYLYKYFEAPPPTPEQFIESSPKLKYVMECIRSVKNYHDAHNEPMSGQIIYMNAAVDYFPLIKEYIVKNLGFNEKEIVHDLEIEDNEDNFSEDEVGIITGKSPKSGKMSKENLKNLFNGEKYNEETHEFERIPDEERIKIIIGSAAIKEGINLQRFSSVLYNCYIDWNPTDIVQIEGRTWRQGNLNENIRIVVPLLIDTIDIFSFQKLQEKTERINKIWSYSNENGVLNLDEFNPEELKFDLIQDMNTIATLKINDQKERLTKEKTVLDIKTSNLNKIRAKLEDVKKYIDKAFEKVNKYREFDTAGLTYVQVLSSLKEKLNEINRSGKNKEGKKIVRGWEYRNLDPKEVDKYIEGVPPSPEYWETSFKLAVRDLTNLSAEFKNTNADINKVASDPELLDAEIKNVLEDIQKIDVEMENIDSDFHRQEIIEDELEWRKDNEQQKKSIEELVNDFSSLNYMLSESNIKEFVKIKKVKKEDISGDNNKENAQNEINSLNLTLKYLDLKKQKTEIDSILDQVNALKTTLKYL